MIKCKFWEQGVRVDRGQRRHGALGKRGVGKDWGRLGKTGGLGGIREAWVKLELAKYYKDSEMTAFISERSRNSK